jgi:transcriptional regulator with XRE-family HTH domain
MKYKTIDEYMRHNRITSKQLAARVNTSPSNMSMIRHGLRRPSPDLARRIEAETGVPFKRLLPEKGGSRDGSRKRHVRKSGGEA